MYRPSGSSVSGSSPFSDVESTIRGLSQDLCTAFNTANYDQVAALYASDGIFMAPHQESAHGRKAVERVVRSYGDSGCQDLRFETTRVDFSSDMALEIGRYSVNIQRGRSTVSDRGNFIRAWRRLGVWLITADCWSSSLPVAEPEIKHAGDAKVA
jgi:uncharacterized protein (TIGR02246 family)